MKRLLIPSIGDPEKKTMGQIFLAKDDTIPEFGPMELLVKVAYNGICGSDGHLLRGNIGPLRPVVLGLIEAMGAIPVGHEFSGVVEEVGEKAAALGFKKGDRIACNYYVGCDPVIGAEQEERTSARIQIIDRWQWQIISLWIHHRPTRFRTSFL